MSILVIADLAGSTLQLEATAKAVNAARSLGAVTLLVAGHGIAEAANRAATLSGVALVRAVDAEWLAPRLPEDLAEIALSQIEGVTHVLAVASSSSRGFMPRLAAHLDVMVIGDVTRILDAATFERTIYAGNALQTVRSSDPIRLVTLRGTAFSGAIKDQPAAPIETLTLARGSVHPTFIADSQPDHGRPDLATAQIVVSGGRGVGSAEGFALVSRLADRLGAAIGASRAAVDAGYAPSDLQVGQTGKAVAPRLYFAIGISGAIQHVAGMKDSETIVVINSDDDAPINQIADYVWVTDLFGAIPDLIAAL